MQNDRDKYTARNERNKIHRQTERDKYTDRLRQIHVQSDRDNYRNKDKYTDTQTVKIHEFKQTETSLTLF